MKNLENPGFLKKFKGIGGEKEIKKAKERKEGITGEKVKGDFESMIQNYLDRFTEFKDNINDTKDGKPKEKAKERFKKIILNNKDKNFITKYENIPDRHWKEKDEEGNMGPFFRYINDQGKAGDWYRMSDDKKEIEKKEYAEPLIKDQYESLKGWLDYFIDDDLSGDIPDYLKYWVFRSVTQLQEYEKPIDWDKEALEKRIKLGGKGKKTEGNFPRRTTNSLKKYPDLHAEALRYIVDAVMDKYKGKEVDFGYDISESEREKFKKFLKNENFAKLYAWAMESFNPVPEHLLPITKGEWKTYEQGSDPVEVIKTLKGMGTGLCIAGKGAASRYLSKGNLHIFYSNDEEHNPFFPRIAIHEKRDNIAEMRGIAYKQNLDPFMMEVAKDKSKEFENGDEYIKKSEDMKKLTEIEEKTKKQEELTKKDLRFLYEIDNEINGFGMTEDPRIKEIREARNPKEDASIILECEPNQIANNPEYITENTRAYIGELKPKIFKTLEQYNIEHIYTKFPEGKIERFEAEMGGKSEQEILKELESRKQLKVDDRDKIYIYDYAKDMLESEDFVRSLYRNPDDPKEKWELKDKEQIKFVKLKVRDLGFSNNVTIKEIYERAEDFGLELCPAETGPQIRLNYDKIFNKEQPKGESFSIAMKEISDRDGDQNVFSVYRNGDGESWLNGRWAWSGSVWDPDHEFVFRPRKSDT